MGSEAATGADSKQSPQKLRENEEPIKIERSNLYLQDDDEFEDFPAGEWDEFANELILKKTIWADTWEEDDEDAPDFADQLRAEREKRKKLHV